MELELRAPSYNADEAIFWLGDDLAPGGYGWAFPCGEGRVRLGVGVVRPDSDAEPRELLDRLAAEFVSYAGGASARVGAIELHSGLMPVIPPHATQLVDRGLVVAGDAAGQGSTLLGEGIRYAIAAGRLAGVAIAESRGDPDGAALATYPRRWQKLNGRNLAISYAVNTRICQFRDDDWDRAIRRLDRLTTRQAAALFASDFSWWRGAGILATDPSVLVSVARAVRQRARGRGAASRRGRSL